MSAADIKKRCRNASNRAAERNYREYVPNSGKILCFHDLDKLVATCKQKAGFILNLNDLEWDIHEYFPNFGK